MPITDLITDRAYLEKIGLLQYIDNNDNDGLLKFMATLDIAIKSYNAIKPGTDPKKMVWLKVAAKINEFKQKRGRDPNENEQTEIIKECLGPQIIQEQLAKK